MLKTFLPVFICLSLVGLCSCVSTGKFKRAGLEYQSKIDTLTNQVAVQRDSIFEKRLQLERAWGANQALLQTQDKLQDRLALQEDNMDDLQGNLKATTTQLKKELAAAMDTIQATKADRDSLRINQRELVKEFEAGLERAAIAMEKALEESVAEVLYSVSISGGELRFSIQEDVLFAPRSVTKLKDEAEPVFRGVMDALQADPLLKLIIVGHTDNKPNPRRNTSNWEYGSLRATRIAEELAEVYYLSPNRVIAASHGEFGPITSNATEEGQATNRRVDFILRNNVANLLRELDKL